MNLLKTKIEGCYIIKNFTAIDQRGIFVKVFNNYDFAKEILQTHYRESYYSISKKNVIRGMHFQLPPYDHEKIIHVVQGSVLDVVLDLRKKSKTYKKFITIKLDSKNKRSIYIPIGCAHGFLSLEDNTIMLYYVAEGYNKDADSGIKFNSFNFKWPVTNPIISERDKNLPLLSKFKSPF